MISISNVVWAVVVLVLGGLGFGVAWWGLKRVNPEEPWRRVCEVLLILGCVLLIISVLLWLAFGYTLFRP